MNLSKEQKTAIRTAVSEPVSIVTGPPGSGKTTMIKAMVATLLANKFNVLLTAPTGAAVNRLFIATGFEAHSIDRLDYHKDLVDKYTGAFIVVDEATMVSTDDFYHMIAMLKPVGFCLVGDYKQLPCNDDGFPLLTTYLKTGMLFPTTVLTSNFRRAGDSGSKLLKCIATLGDPDFEIDDGDDSFNVVECLSEAQVLAAAKQYFSEKPSQMLTFTNSMVDKLNRLTESSYPIVVPAMGHDSPAVREGDRVVCTENLYDNGELLVANGVIGTCYADKVIYQNDFIDKMRKARTNADTIRKRVRTITEGANEGMTFRSKFIPSRCMTVHKAQGSEFSEQGIIVLANWKGEMMLEHAYTALSRFKSGVVVIGTKDQINKTFHAKFNEVYEHELVRQMKKQARDLKLIY